jgi:hypothetical protein
MSTECAGSVIPTGVTAKFSTAEMLIDKAATTSGKKARKLFRRAKTVLKRADSKVVRAAVNLTIAVPCGAVLEQAVNTVRSTLGS